jgi:hypothetical protein
MCSPLTDAYNRKAEECRKQELLEDFRHDFKRADVCRKRLTEAYFEWRVTEYLREKGTLTETLFAKGSNRLEIILEKLNPLIYMDFVRRWGNQHYCHTPGA